MLPPPLADSSRVLRVSGESRHGQYWPRREEGGLHLRHFRLGTQRPPGDYVQRFGIEIRLRERDAALARKRSHVGRELGHAVVQGGGWPSVSGLSPGVTGLLLLKKNAARASLGEPRRLMRDAAWRAGGERSARNSVTPFPIDRLALSLAA